MEFKPIETQEQFDEMIADRLERERKTVAGKYADYEELKSRNAEYVKQIEEANRKAKEADAEAEKTKKETAELKEKVRRYETDSAKRKIAREYGIDEELAGRLTGEDETSIRKDAEAMADVLRKHRKAPPLRSTEPSGEDEETAAYRKVLAGMKGEE